MMPSSITLPLIASRRFPFFWACLLCLLPAASLRAADYPRQWFLNAHNCYPAGDHGADRLERARRSGLSVIEIDLAWSERRRRAVITHTTKLTGSEPTIEAYFWKPMLPELEKMPRGRPGILVIFDFKDHQPGTVKQVYQFLQRRRALITACGKRGDSPATPLDWRPLTVLLSGDQEAIAMFERLTPPTEPYLAMGNREPPNDNKFQENVANYFPEPATAFYRVFNFNWAHIEKSRNNQAGDFTPEERNRLIELVEAGRSKGYWLRAWTLNADSTAWSPEDNFGSREALLARWRAAWEAGLDNVATDEYELAGEFLRSLGSR
ncbi:MAG TPA: hypothetical protein VFA54_17360 [Bryobacterales bacterium]|nr:hypothetical protein [Bryobacterales bacterium]